MQFVYDTFPYLFRVEVPQLKDKEREIAEKAVRTFNSDFNVENGYNVQLTPDENLEQLWQIFTDVCNKTFDNISPIENKTYAQFWAYVQNSERYTSVWHNHIKTASINAVYYPWVPDETGNLSVITNGGEVIEIPVIQGTMLIFPGWLIHRPNPQLTSKEPRVSINIELLTDSRPSLKAHYGSELQKVMW